MYLANIHMRRNHFELDEWSSVNRNAFQWSGVRMINKLMWQERVQQEIALSYPAHSPVYLEQRSVFTIHIKQCKPNYGAAETKEISKCPQN